MLLTYTSAIPTEEGWYWVKELDGKVRVIQLTKNEDCLGFWVTTTRGTAGFTVEDLATVHGWKFAGPLQEPLEDE